MGGTENMRKNLFWLNDDAWQKIEPFLPDDVRGKDRVDDRRVISGSRASVLVSFIIWLEYWSTVSN